jgi:hypothetical protein
LLRACDAAFWPEALTSSACHDNYKSFRHKRYALPGEKNGKIRVGVFSIAGQLCDYLDFHPRYALLADRLSQLIATHATPVGCNFNYVVSYIEIIYS